jgi:hypothetical protein
MADASEGGKKGEAIEREYTSVTVSPLNIVSLNAYFVGFAVDRINHCLIHFTHWKRGLSSDSGTSGPAEASQPHACLP